MKNTINILFFTLLSILLLIAFWENISSHEVDQRLYEIGRTANPTLTHPVTKEKILLPLGTDQNRRDYAVVLSSAFRYNLLISIKGAVLFLVSGILFGLGMSMIEEAKIRINSFKNIILKSAKYLSDILSEMFQSIPLLIVLIVSVLFFEISIKNPEIRFQYTIYILAIFSSPKLSFQIDGIIKKLKKEEFLLAAKASGISKTSLIIKHILYYESKGVIMLQTINFFLFTIMIEIFLTYFGKGSTLSQSSLGSLVFNSASYLPNINHLIDIGRYQNVLLTLTPFIFIILLCITIRWLGNRILILTDTK